MTQTSGPSTVGTLAQRQFTDVMWRRLFGDEPGVLGDVDGSAYRVTLPTNSDIASVGSATQDSVSRVAGFLHVVPAGEPESITIPAASGSARTDLIVVRYDAARADAPAPCRLERIAGTSAGLPSYDAGPPGVEDLPLWAITRQPGQALSQATTTRLFPRLAPSLEVPPAAALPLSSPLGSVARQGGATYVRQLDANGVPVWAQQSAGTVALLASTASTGASGTLIHGGVRQARSINIPQHAAGNLHLRCSAIWTSPVNAAATWTFQLNGATVAGSGVRSVNVSRGDTPVPVTLDAWVPTTGAARTLVLAASVETNGGDITLRESAFSVWLH